MKKHMLDEDGLDIDYEKKAAKNMALEIFADSDIVRGLQQYSDPKMTDRLKKDAADTVFKQIQRYSTVIEDDEIIRLHIEILNEHVDRYDLPDPNGHWRPKIKSLDQSISKHSYAEHFLGR